MHFFAVFIIAFLFSLSAVQTSTPAPASGNYRLNITPAGYGGGGRFTTIAFDPQNSQTLLVGSDVAGVFKSTDGGGHFKLKGRGLQAFNVADIAYHPFSSRRVYLLVSDGLYISDDSGESWQKKSAAVRYPDRFFGSRLMVFSKYSLWVATHHDGVFQIPTHTSDFKAIPIPGLEKIKINGLAIYNRHLFAGTAKGVYRYYKGRWQKHNQGLDPSYRHIVDIMAHSANKLYIVEKQKGPFIWNESKQQWQQRNPSLLNLLTIRSDSTNKVSFVKDFKALAVNPKDPKHLFVSNYPDSWPHMLFNSTNSGKSWKAVQTFRLAPDAADFWSVAKTLANPEHIAFVPQAPNQIYLLDWLNVWKSTDQGHSWMQLHHGLQNVVINDIKIHPQDPNTIYLSAWDNGLMVTRDAGKTWKQHMTGVAPGHAQELEISSKNPNKMYLLTNPWQNKGRIYVYKTMNMGKTWQDISIPAPKETLPRKGFVSGMSTNLEIDPFSDDIVYVATNGYGIFKTKNGGRSWKAVNNGLKTPYIQGPNALRIHPKNPRILYASTMEGGIYRSDDAGRNWRALNPNQPFTYGLALDPYDPAHILAGIGGEKILITHDGGRSWTSQQLPGKASDSITVNSIAFHPLKPHIVFAGTLGFDAFSDGLFFSRDGGRNFEPLDLGLPMVNINSIHVLKSPEIKALVGFNGIGLFRLHLTD